MTVLLSELWALRAGSRASSRVELRKVLLSAVRSAPLR